MKTHLYLLAMLFGASALLQGCGNDDMPQPDVPAPSPNGEPTATLTIGCVNNGAISRATAPTYEDGFANENAIVDAMILVYNKPLNSTTLTDNDKVQAAVYINSLSTATEPESLTAQYYDNSGTAHTISEAYHNYYIANKYSNSNTTSLSQALQSKLSDNTDYYAIAIANFGDMSTTFEGMKISELRDWIYSGDLYDSGYVKDDDDNAIVGVKGYGKFRMTGVNEVKFKWLRNDDVTIPTFMVQRLAARIDIAFGYQATGESTLWTMVEGEYVYDVECEERHFLFPIYDPTTDKRIAGAVFTLTDIRLNNCVVNGTYLLEQSSGTPKYLGNESWNTSTGLATNRIITPADTTAVTNGLKRDFQLCTLAATPTDAQTVIETRGLHIIDTSDHKFGVYATLGYVGENTYASYDVNNKYTDIEISGTTTLVDDHFNTIDNTSTHTVVGAIIPLRHSFGAFNIESPNPLYYGIVRNTIYRVLIKFYAEGGSVRVRYYYYDGTDSGSNFTDKYFETDVFNKYIIEGTGPTND